MTVADSAPVTVLVAGGIGAFGDWFAKLRGNGEHREAQTVEAARGRRGP